MLSEDQVIVPMPKQMKRELRKAAERDHRKLADMARVFIREGLERLAETDAQAKQSAVNAA